MNLGNGTINVQNANEIRVSPVLQKFISRVGYYPSLPNYYPNDPLTCYTKHHS